MHWTTYIQVPSLIPEIQSEENDWPVSRERALSLARKKTPYIDLEKEQPNAYTRQNSHPQNGEGLLYYVIKTFFQIHYE